MTSVAIVKNMRACFALAILSLAALFALCSVAHAAWPTSAQWIPVYKNYAYLQDPNGDSTGSRNVVSDATHPAAYFFNDGAYIYFRLRLDKTPAGTGGQGLLEAYGWGVEFDTNNNPNDYEWLLMVDGISKDEAICLYQNTVQGVMGDPSDKPEILSASLPLSGNYQIAAADSSLNGEQDYFLDWRFPYSTFKTYTGLVDQSPLRMFFGASPSANNLTQNGGDFVGGSDLVSGFSDYVTTAGIPLGPIPSATGTVGFVSDLTGASAVTSTIAGNALFVKVADSDKNVNVNAADTVSVTVSTGGGDAEPLILTETGPNTGIFTGTINSKLSATPVRNNGTIDLQSGETVTATYIDARDAANRIDQVRTASVVASLTLLPQLNLVKSTDKTEALPGAEITYAIHYLNVGNADGYSVELSDAVPSYATYVAGSMRLGNATSTYSTAAPKTDAAGDDEAEFTGNSVLFRIPVVRKNDGAANSGPDEGNVFYKVTIN